MQLTLEEFFRRIRARITSSNKYLENEALPESDLRRKAMIMCNRFDYSTERLRELVFSVRPLSLEEAYEIREIARANLANAAGLLLYINDHLEYHPDSADDHVRQYLQRILAEKGAPQ